MCTYTEENWELFRPLAATQENPTWVDTCIHLSRSYQVLIMQSIYANDSQKYMKSNQRSPNVTTTTMKKYTESLLSTNSTE